jgi:Spy/CpxP family protein refolding chaperone
MKTKIFMLGLMMSLSVVLIAQPEENGAKSFHGKPQLGFKPGEFKKDANRLNLSEAQKESFKASTMATQKLLLPLRNELGEAEAHQKTLLSAEKPDFAAINKNIEKIGGIRIEMAKIQTKHRLEMRAQLTEEQRLKLELFKGKMKQGNGRFGHRLGLE